MVHLKLIADTPMMENFDYIVEEKNNKSPSNLYITGPYMMAEEVNKNKRRYQLNEMVQEVENYKNTFIANSRALGEMNHPESVEVNPERACHMVLELRQDGNTFYGKSKVLSSPMGQIVRALINDGVKLGMSTRALGQLNELADGTNQVSNFKLIAIDCVADPSMPKAFVNGILESKQYVLKERGDIEEIYGALEKKISSLPKKEIDAYLRESIVEFINRLTIKL